MVLTQHPDKFSGYYGISKPSFEDFEELLTLVNRAIE
jgi:hypothetical protein